MKPRKGRADSGFGEVEDSLRDGRLTEPWDNHFSLDFKALREYKKITGVGSYDLSIEDFYRIAKPSRNGKLLTWDEFLNDEFFWIDPPGRKTRE